MCLINMTFEKKDKFIEDKFQFWERNVMMLERNEH